MLADEITTGIYRKLIQKFPENIVFSNTANIQGKRVVILLKNFKYFMPLETVQIWLVMYCPLIDGLIDTTTHTDMMSKVEEAMTGNIPLDKGGIIHLELNSEPFSGYYVDPINQTESVGILRYKAVLVYV